MPKVKLSNGMVLNFPDEMSQEDIKSVIQKKFPIDAMPQQPHSSIQPEEETHQQKTFLQKIQDFLQPEKLDRQGNPMVETIFGRMPKEMPEYKSGTPENKEMLNEMIVAGAGAPGMQNVVKGISNLSLKNIGKNILEAKNKEKLFHTTQYNRLWEAAKKAGINNIKINPNEIDIEVLTSSGANKKYLKPLQKFLDNPTLENAQVAQSDLGKLINSPQLSKEVLTSEEMAVKNAAEKSQKHIRDMMFRNEKGEVNQPLKKMYDQITSSYEKNMVPYKNKAINEFQKGKMTAKQLIQKLKSGSFMATKGAAHPELERRDFAIDLAKTIGVPTSIVAALGMGLGGSELLNKLLGRNE